MPVAFLRIKSTEPPPGWNDRSAVEQVVSFTRGVIETAIEQDAQEPLPYMLFAVGRPAGCESDRLFSVNVAEILEGSPIEECDALIHTLRMVLSDLRATMYTVIGRDDGVLHGFTEIYNSTRGRVSFVVVVNGPENHTVRVVPSTIYPDEPSLLPCHAGPGRN